MPAKKLRESGAWGAIRYLRGVWVESCPSCTLRTRVLSPGVTQMGRNVVNLRGTGIAGPENVVTKDPECTMTLDIITKDFKVENVL